MKCITGRIGSGKSFLMIWLLLEAVRAGRWVKAVFPHRPAALRLIAELVALFGEAVFDFLLVEDLDQVDKVVMRKLILAPPPGLSPWERRQLCEEYAWADLERQALRRKIEDIAVHPNLEQFGRLILAVGQHQDAWYPEEELGRCLRPLSRWWRYFRNHCTSGALREELIAAQFVLPRDRPMSLQAAERLYASTHGCTPVAARTSRPPRLATADFLSRGHTGERPGVLLFVGGASSPDGLRTLVGCDLHETAALALKGEIGPGIYAIDEFQNYGFNSSWLAQKAATLRFTGTELAVVQHAFDWDTEAGRKLAQQCEHYVFALPDADNADYGAKLLRGSYDRMAVHHEEEVVRTGTDVRYEEQVSVTEGPAGKSVTKRTVPVHVPGQWTTKKPVYESGDSQQFWRAGNLQDLADRVCWVKPHGGKPYEFPVPEVPDSWRCRSGSASEEVAEQCIKDLMARLPVYETPAVVTVPDEPDPEPPPKKPRQKKPSNQAARKLGKPRGNK